MNTSNLATQIFNRGEIYHIILSNEARCEESIQYLCDHVSEDFTLENPRESIPMYINY